MSKYYKSKKRSHKKFRSANAEVKVRHNEDLESAIKRFNNQIEEDGFMEIYMSKMRYEKPSDARRRKKQEQIYRTKKEKKNGR